MDSVSNPSNGCGNLEVSKLLGNGLAESLTAPSGAVHSQRYNNAVVLGSSQV